jgi:eukaryotic-like serine/threonine-protein kinase
MTPERWQHIKEVYYGALERPPGERSSFIDSACAGDKTARQEVSELISAYEETGEFLVVPAFELAARSLVHSQPEGLVEGQIITHYSVIRSLGAGGMGEVYLAEDTHLRRRVALKLLPASFMGDTERVRRFEREAHAASSLNHPNVCTIHEVAETEDSRRFIVMEYVEGVTLRRYMEGGRMELTEVLDVATQIASGLAAAHDVGVVHRDIKPENIMLRPDGIVKVLDFGLAKLTQQESNVDSAVTTRPRVQTDTGMVMGTALYMSPEQARALAVDARTDIWSLGVVLYEMSSGRAPFGGETPSHVIVSILESEPPPLSRDPGMPAELQRIVEKALRKNRGERYQTARDLALDLRSLKEELEVEARRKRRPEPDRNGNESGARRYELGMGGANREPAASTGQVMPARLTQSAERLICEIRRHKTFAVAALLALFVGAISLTYFALKRNEANSRLSSSKSIAVLPLKPINVSSRDEIYEIGIADSLIYRLSAVKGLIVRPLNATRKYTDVAQDPLAAGKEQQADYVLASNYQLAAGKIRVTAQLLNVSSGYVEQTYKSEKDTVDVFAMQDAIAREVGDLLLARFAPTSSSPTTTRGTTNEDAYRLYLQGMFLVEKENLADAKRAIELFDQAVSLDPNYAKAWAGKARAHCTYAHFGGSSPGDAFAKAKPALERALVLDENLPEAYGVLGTIRADYDWNFAEAEKDFLRAIELAPNSDTPRRWYANRLAGLGRSEEAIAAIKIAIDVNPNSVFHQIMYGRILYYARRYDEAITQLQRVIEMDSAIPLIYHLLWKSYHMKGDYPRAYESFLRFQLSIGTKDEMLKSYETAYAKSGWQAVLLRYRDVKANDPSGSAAYTMAVLSALVGQREQSFRYLDDAVNNRSLEVPNIVGEPSFDSLRGDARFTELVRRVGFR